VDAAGHAVQQRVADRGDLVERAPERVRRQHDARDRVDRADRRVARRRVEQRQLTEVVAGSELRDVGAAAVHPRATVRHHEEAVAGVALDDDVVAGFERVGLAEPADEVELRGGAPLEHRHLREVHAVQRLVVPGQWFPPAPEAGLYPAARRPVSGR
jgi:hypothetical protein